MLLPKEMESMLITVANIVDTTKVAVPETVKVMYQQDIDACKLKLQLHTLPDLVKAFKNLTQLTVTKVSTITEMLVAVPVARDMFSEVDKLIRLCQTIPVTACTAERSFSSLRRF